MRKREELEELEEVHVMPTNDCVEHIESITCICSPQLDANNLQDLEDGTANKVLIIHTLVWAERQ